MAQILHGLSYKVCSITLSKFNTFGLFIMILGTSAIMDQTACCYNVTTSETGLYRSQSVLNLARDYFIQAPFIVPSLVCEIPRSFERSSPSDFRTQGSFIHINSRKFSNATFFRQIALQNLQRKNLGFSETELASNLWQEVNWDGI